MPPSAWPGPAAAVIGPWPSLGLNLPFVEGSMDGRTPRWADIRAMAQAAEDAGFDAVWVSDHLGFGDPDGDWSGAWESWTLLSALAGATSSVRLGTYVTAAPYRNPALLAKMAETLDEVSGGQVVLGLGAAWNRPEFEAFGFPWERRFDRFEDGLRIVTSMLRSGRADHEGLESAHGARIEPRGPRRGGPPVMVGAGGPRMLRLTAELADAWNAGLVSPAELAPKVDALALACLATGRDPATLHRSAETVVELGSGDEAIGTPSDDEGSGARPLRGSPERIATGLRRYRALGMDHLQVQLRPNRLASVVGFRAVIEALGADG